MAEPTAARCEEVRRQPQASCRRDPEIRREREGPLETFRGDADHGERRSIQHEGPAHDRRVGPEAPHPERVAQDGDGIHARRAVLVRREEPPQRRPRFQHVEQIAAHRGERIACRRPAPRDHGLRLDLQRREPAHDRAG
jgi:hypothetical protein